MVNPFDLVLCEKHTVDGETGQVGPKIATLLGLPQISGARRLVLVPAGSKAARVEAERESDEGYERVEAQLPVLVTTAPPTSALSPTSARYPSAPAPSSRKRRRCGPGAVGSDQLVVLVFGVDFLVEIEVVRLTLAERQ